MLMSNIEGYGYLSLKNPTECINQIKQNTTKSCAYFTGYTASQGYNSDGTNYCSLGILRKKLTAFFQIILKIAGNNTHCPECWSRTLFRDPNLHITLPRYGKNAVIPAMLFFLHRLSTYQWFHITFCWQKCIIHESDVTWASWRTSTVCLKKYSG